MNSPGQLSTSGSPKDSKDVFENALVSPGIEMEVDSAENPVDKLLDIEILPELYHLMHDLKSGKLQVKDFDNNAGNLRLKISSIRQTLQNIEGIEESVTEREERIKTLKIVNEKKKLFLSSLKTRINDDINPEEEMAESTS